MIEVKLVEFEDEIFLVIDKDGETIFHSDPYHFRKWWDVIKILRALGLDVHVTETSADNDEQLQELGIDI